MDNYYDKTAQNEASTTQTKVYKNMTRCQVLMMNGTAIEALGYWTQANAIILYDVVRITNVVGDVLKPQDNERENMWIPKANILYMTMESKSE